MCGDLVGRDTAFGRAEHVGFPGGQRAGAGLQRSRYQLRVNHPLPSGDPADAVGQGLGGGILDDEPADVSFQRPKQIPGLAEPGQDEDLAIRKLLVQLSGGGQAVKPRHVNIEDRDIRPGPDRGFHDLIAALQLRDDLHVCFEGEQGHKRAADHVHVLGNQHTDHVISPGIQTRSRNLPSPVASAEIEPETASARSASPVSPDPRPDGARAPSLATSSQTPSSPAASAIEQLRASLCRSTLVVPSRTAQASTSCACSGGSARSVFIRTSIPAAVSRAAAASISPRNDTQCSSRAMASTSCSALRATPVKLSISERARAGSKGSNLSARSPLSEIADRLWPSRSCRSRETRRRSCPTAPSACSFLAAYSSSAALTRRTAAYKAALYSRKSPDQAIPS